MTTDPHAKPAHGHHVLLDAVLQHFAREEAGLAEMRRHLQSIRAGLGSAGQKELDHVPHWQAELSRAQEVLRQGRKAFRDDVAQCLRIPAEQVTLDRLIAELPPEMGHQLEQARGQLRQLALGVEHLNLGNALLIHYSMEFWQGLLATLSGRQSSGGRYGPEGARCEAPCGSFIQVQG